MTPPADRTIDLRVDGDLILVLLVHVLSDGGAFLGAPAHPSTHQHTAIHTQQTNTSASSHPPLPPPAPLPASMRLQGNRQDTA